MSPLSNKYIDYKQHQRDRRQELDDIEDEEMEEMEEEENIDFNMKADPQMQQAQGDDEEGVKLVPHIN